MRYHNEYGTVELTPITEHLPIGDIHFQLTAVQENLLSLDEAEQIALISENAGIQIAIHLSGAAYVILHDGPRHGAVCHCHIVSWQSQQAASKELDDLHKNPYAGPMAVAL